MGPCVHNTCLRQCFSSKDVPRANDLSGHGRFSCVASRAHFQLLLHKPALWLLCLRSLSLLAMAWKEKKNLLLLPSHGHVEGALQLLLQVILGPAAELLISGDLCSQRDLGAEDRQLHLRPPPLLQLPPRLGASGKVWSLMASDHSR